MGKKETNGNSNSNPGILSKVVKDYDISDSSGFNQVIQNMLDSGGFEGRHLATGIEILKNMVNENNCTRFLSFVGALISTGNRGIVRDMVKNKMFDCIITTCGSLDHDIARSFSCYFEGDFRLDDKFLLKKNIHRLGNILIPNKNYGVLLEDKVQSILQDLYDKSRSSKEFSPSEIIKYIGSKMNQTSFLYWASKNNIPVIVPGIVDGCIGNQIWLFNQNHKDFKIDVLKDQTELSELVFESKLTGAFMMGGGISKHHTLWWNQYRGGLDYAVYITTSSEWDGSLSGATVSEAISWGKITANAKQITIHADVSTVLPFIYYALLSSKK
ncbi:MAG: deoxyhypusine synthase [Thermoproteota archaeon]|nr:deoxyhypusine synthase [Thermoproteota archaeon]